jgi:hypothetical protein
MLTQHQPGHDRPFQHAQRSVDSEVQHGQAAAINGTDRKEHQDAKPQTEQPADCAEAERRTERRDVAAEHSQADVTPQRVDEVFGDRVDDHGISRTGIYDRGTKWSVSTGK